ncbi:MAG TPA: type II toxin-antitoxin system RelE/ParE family toxin [Lacipirellula sp.]
MYTVLVAARAEQDLKEQHDWWAANRSAAQAARWYRRILERILSLEHSPHAHPLADEEDVWPFAVRQFNFGLGHRPTHRVLFAIRETDVVVFRVRHLSQAPITADDL